MGKGGRDVNAATAGRDGANKSGSRPRTLMSIPTDDEPAADKIVQNRKVKGKPLIEFRRPDMGHMPKAVDTGYDVKPFNAEALLPQVMWKDPGECLEEFVPGSQMPAAVWLGM